MLNNLNYVKTTPPDDEVGKIKWPSSRIAQGGLFHSPKVVYSKETADLLKLLMEESKMTMLMRNRINYHLRNGEPLPKIEPPKTNKSISDSDRALQIIQKAGNERRKSLQAIMASGAYDQPNYRPLPDCRVPCCTAKLKLQETMSGFRMSANSHIKPKRKPTVKVSDEPEDLIDELLQQIDERADWLAEMEELGKGQQYRSEIQAQIADRLKRIKVLEKKIEMKKQGYRFVD